MLSVRVGLAVDELLTCPPMPLHYLEVLDSQRHLVPSYSVHQQDRLTKIIHQAFHQKVIVEAALERHLSDLPYAPPTADEQSRTMETMEVVRLDGQLFHGQTTEVEPLIVLRPVEIVSHKRTEVMVGSTKAMEFVSVVD
jgi:hypothetical protein